MKRRNFLKNTSLAAIPFSLQGLDIQSYFSHTLMHALNGKGDRVLVLIQLNGGNDGLNTVIPLDQYAGLSAVRNPVLIQANRVIKINNELGLHPSLKDLYDVWNNGMLQIIQGVGYPNQNRSHFRSQDIWFSSSGANEFVATGWLGRYFDHELPNFPDGFPNSDCPDPIAISVGNNVSETCQGTRGNFSLSVIDPTNITNLDDPNLEPVPSNCYGMELSFLRDAVKQTNAYSGRIKEAAGLGRNLSTKYVANNQLAQRLKTVARLISGGLKTKVYIVSMNGFDTHAGQVNSNDTTTGTHANLLSQLSNAICSFQDDLIKMGLEKKVIGMTFSEFGRRIKSLGSGTDHGSAAPMILFGSCINSSIIGSNPIISATAGDQEGVAMQYDFRSVYGSILNQWFGVEDALVKSLVYDQYQLIPIVQGCDITATYDNEKIKAFQIQARSNIIDSEIRLDITSAKAQTIHLSLYNDQGFQLKQWSIAHQGSGNETFDIAMEQYPNGIYFVRAADKSFQQTERIVKVK